MRRREGAGRRQNELAEEIRRRSSDLLKSAKKRPKAVMRRAGDGERGYARCATTSRYRA